jgi:uncharacterized peroxidase-related enzyme
MAFIDTISAHDAEGDVREMYSRQQRDHGFVPNYAKVFSHRPEVMTLWSSLLAGIRRHIEPRRFELVTTAAAHALGNSYCSLAHGEALTRYMDAEQVLEMVCGHASTTLTPADAAVVAFARKIASNASTISVEDVETLKAQGLTDAEIFDVAAAAAARAFFAKLLDALGAEPDASFREMDAALREALVTGRRVDEHEPQRLPT